MFQSLLCWIMVCKKSDAAPFTDIESLFQSLLCWIMVCKNEAQALESPRCPRFNPCYVGLWSVRTLKLPEVDMLQRFQSLLCWIMVCKSIPDPDYFVPACFNPCYVGLWSVSIYGGHR